MAMIVITTGVAGCSARDEPGPAPTDGFSMLIDSYLDAPEAANYDEEQVAALEKARDVGELSFEAYAEAIDRSLECIGGAGFYVKKDPPDDSRGFPTVGYFYEGPEAGNPVADKCIEANSQAVESVYQLQPVSAEAEAKVRLDHIDAVIACLKRSGADAEAEELAADELTADEFDARLGRLLVEANEISEERALAIASCDSEPDS